MCKPFAHTFFVDQNKSMDPDDSIDNPFRHGRYNMSKTLQQLDTTTLYKMTSTPRGIAVIINNKNFLESSGQHLSSRDGTEVDREALKRLFKKLQFKVEVYNNQTKAEMRRIAMGMAMSNHSMYDACILAILTHGLDGVVYGIDGTIPIRDIISPFKKCKTLAGKPKIFFFQACQGQEFMDGLDVPDAPHQHSTSKVTVPVEADFIYAYSTVPGYYSWRNSTGSWFIKSVVKVFEENAYHMEVLQMLTRVNALISTFKSRHPVALDKRQVSTTVSMLTKDLYFFPQTKGQNGDKRNADTSNCKMN